jgi:hypothetical protein
MGNGKESKDSPLTTIVVAVIIALLAGGSAPWWWEKLFPPSNPNQSKRSQTTITLHMRTVAVPKSVRPGEKVALHVIVTDRNKNSVEGVKIVVSAGGGKFLETENAPYDPRANLMGPFRSAGLTSLAGEYTTWWVCNPCAPGYGLGVRATKDGYTKAVDEVSVKISR